MKKRVDEYSKSLCCLVKESPGNFNSFLEVSNTLNIRLNTFSAGGCCQWYLLCSLESFRSSNIILSSPRRTYQRWSVSDTPSSSCNIGKKGELNWIFIYLDDYWPLIGTSDWLLLTTNQIRGSVNFSDLRLFKIIHLHFRCFPVQYTALAELVVFLLFFSLSLFSSFLALAKKTTRSIHLEISKFTEAKLSRIRSKLT